MSSELDRELAVQMARWEAAALRRQLATQDRKPVERANEFTSNDYLGLARHPDVVATARAALEEFGAGARASRLLGGGSPLDERAERAIATWMGAESALLFASGYQANLGLVTSLAGRGDAVISDERNHASLIDAARLSRARVLVHRHVDLDDLAAQLRFARGARRRLVLTESIFSMDGDAAPLAAIHALCVEHDAWLAVDEAHAIGLIGPHGAGGWAALELEGSVPTAAHSRLSARMATGGKALGVSAAFVVGSALLREHLVNHARSFVYSTALSPAVSGALCAAIPLAITADDARERALAVARAIARGLDLPTPSAAIVPIVVGSSQAALALERELAERGFGVRAVRPPTVPEGTARLRLACHAFNKIEAVERLVAALASRGTSSVNRSECGTPSANQPACATPLGRSPDRAALETIFVVGTDTNVGKTVVSALLVRAAARCGGATYWKPVQTGSDDDTREVERLAARTLATSSGARRDRAAHSARLVEPACSFALAASPHQAAAAAGTSIRVSDLDARLAQLRSECNGTLIVELAGGLLVPYTDEITQADWLASVYPSIVLVARSGLGTLNHTLLTIEALAARQLGVRALFLVGAPHDANRDTLSRATGIEAIYCVPTFTPLDAHALQQWLAQHDLSPIFGAR